jgi:hypothetical protein
MNILLQIHQKENLNEYGNPEDFKIEDFMFSSLMKPGLGRICNYRNISKGKSMVFSSINQYAHHWYKNHKDFDFYTSSKDLARYFHLFRLGYEVKLEERQ